MTKTRRAVDSSLGQKIRTGSTKPLRALLATLLFLLLFLGIYWAHAQFFRVDVLLYSSIADGVLAVCLAGIALCTRRIFNELNIFEKTQLCVIWLLLAFSCAIAGPTVIDRSLSFYILEKIQQRGGAIRLGSIEDVFTKEYIKEHRVIDVRLTEQLQSGTIVIDEGWVRLTRRGDNIARFSRIFRKHFLPRQRLTCGAYTDTLIDPFRQGENATIHSDD